MRKWVFVVVADDPRALLTARLSAGLWPLRVQTPHRSVFAEGDEVVLYMGKPECAFAGTAMITSKTLKVSSPMRKDFAETDRAYKGWEYGVKLADAKLWKEAVPVRPLIQTLEMFPRKDCWGAFLQSGVVALNQNDYQKILGENHG